MKDLSPNTGITVTGPVYTAAVLVSLKADSHITCRAHAVPFPCHAAKGLECVFRM
jgi:hypothetical protein